MISTPIDESRKPKNEKVFVVEVVFIVCKLRRISYNMQKSEFYAILSLKYLES
jgi:hypothetical protein